MRGLSLSASEFWYRKVVQRPARRYGHGRTETEAPVRIHACSSLRYMDIMDLYGLLRPQSGVFADGF